MYHRLHRVCPLLALSFCLLAVGCVRSLTLRETGENLIGKVHSIAPLTEQQAQLDIEVTRWGPEYKIKVGDKKFKNFQEFRSTPVEKRFIYESSWSDSKYLVQAMNSIGYKRIDVDPEFQIAAKYGRKDYLFINSDPTYSVEGIYKFTPPPYFGLMIAWDVLMAVPSVFTPVPMFGGAAIEVIIKIHDGKTGKLVSTIDETIDFGLIGFSVWGLAGGTGYLGSDYQALLAFLLNRELLRLESPEAKASR